MNKLIACGRELIKHSKNFHSSVSVITPVRVRGQSTFGVNIEGRVGLTSEVRVQGVRFVRKVVAQWPFEVQQVLLLCG